MLYTRGDQEASGLACLCEWEVKKLKNTAGGSVRTAALSQFYHTLFRQCWNTMEYFFFTT